MWLKQLCYLFTLLSNRNICVNFTTSLTCDDHNSAQLHADQFYIYMILPSLKMYTTFNRLDVYIWSSWSHAFLWALLRFWIMNLGRVFHLDDTWRWFSMFIVFVWSCIDRIEPLVNFAIISTPRSLRNLMFYTYNLTMWWRQSCLACDGEHHKEKLETCSQNRNVQSRMILKYQLLLAMNDVSNPYFLSRFFTWSLDLKIYKSFRLYLLK